MFARELAQRLFHSGFQDVVSVSVHPGQVATNIAGSLKDHSWVWKVALAILEPVAALIIKTPAEGAQTTLMAATAPAFRWGALAHEGDRDKVVSGRDYVNCFDYPHISPFIQNQTALDEMWAASLQATSDQEEGKSG